MVHNFAISILFPVLAWIGANFEFSIGVGICGVILAAGARITNREARRIARENGFREVKVDFDTHKKPAFQKGNDIITPDRDGHNGGAWKQFDAKTKKRVATLDENLKPITK